MIALNIKIPRQPIAHLSHALERMESEMGRAPGEMLSDVAARFMVGARKRTTLGRRKNRLVIKNPKRRETYTTKKGTQRTRTVKSESRYNILVRRSGRPVQLIPTDDRKDPRRIIDTRGLGRDTWSLGLSQLGRPMGKTHTNRRKANRLIRVSKNLTGASPFVSITNQAGYIKATSPRVIPASMSAVARYLSKRLDDHAAKLSQGGR